jgi:hypothetical protein
MDGKTRQLSPLLRDMFLGLSMLVLLSGIIIYQHQTLKDVTQTWEKYEHKTKLPSSEVLKMMTLGYDNVYADWLWLQSIQAFGMGWITDDGSTEPIYQYFDTLTDIDPHFISAYRFANLIIGDNRLDWELGQEILKKGVYKNPNNYDIPYLGLYNAVWSRSDPMEARWFASRLKRIPETPKFMIRLEEYIERKSGRFEIAYEYNIRYYLEYEAAGNDVEQDIINNRLKVLFDQWYRKEIKNAIDCFREKFDDHPLDMEELIASPCRPDFKAPTVQSFLAAIDRFDLEIASLSPNDSIPEELVAKIKDLSMIRLVGLPPEPNGSWYMIHSPTRYAFLQGKYSDVSEYKYVITALDLIPQLNGVAIGAQKFIMTYYTENGELPDDSQMLRFYGRDALGGHFVYQREAEESPVYGVFYSTSGRRFNEKKEPRMGISGLGPFPFKIEPQLSDNPIDKEWGIENGFILDDGTEVWQSIFDATTTEEIDLEVSTPSQEDQE